MIVPGKTQAMLDAEAGAAVVTRRRAEIRARLDELDRAAIRSVRAISLGKGVQKDQDALEAIEIEVESLRAELAGLE